MKSCPDLHIQLLISFISLLFLKSSPRSCPSKAFLKGSGMSTMIPFGQVGQAQFNSLELILTNLLVCHARLFRIADNKHKNKDFDLMVEHTFKIGGAFVISDYYWITVGLEMRLPKQDTHTQRSELVFFIPCLALYCSWFTSLSGENWRLVTDDPVQFEK